MYPVRFNQYHVTDGTVKARVSYSLDNHVTYSHCVTLYARDYGEALGRLFADYVNQTDTQTDYFDKGHVTFTPGHPCYAAARARAEMILQKQAATRDARNDTRTQAQRDAASYAYHNQVD